MDKTSQPALQIDAEAFRDLAHQLVDQVADYFESLEERPVTPGLTPAEIAQSLPVGAMPDQGETPQDILNESTEMLMSQSLLAGHPRFWGYIIGSGTQIGTLADMLAATINPNVGGWHISPMASEVEKQTIGWIADWVGYPKECGGLLVSGGAMANYVGFLTARRMKLGEQIRSKGLRHLDNQPVLYCSQETHTWVQKAADLFGMGTDAIRWIPGDADLRMDTGALRQAIDTDIADGKQPFLVIGTAGTVSSGVVDNLRQLRGICDQYDLWFHVDGAYGAPACALPECETLFDGLSDADSIALDPHKWFYSPQEAGCALVKNKQHLLDTYSYRPPYYHFEEFEEEPGINYYEYGLQNSRGFRALKVWMGLRQAGKEGLRAMIRHDIQMARLLYDIVNEAEDFEAVQTNLSITTFRFVPDHQLDLDQLNALNEDIMVRLQNSGRAFVTNAVAHSQFLLRACIVNFRTTRNDIKSLPGIIRDIAAAL